MTEDWRRWRLAPFFDLRWQQEQSRQIEQWMPDIDWLALMQAQEAIVQQRPWSNPFGIDWNIRQSPDWKNLRETERQDNEAHVVEVRNTAHPE